MDEEEPETPRRRPDRRRTLPGRGESWPRRPTPSDGPSRISAGSAFLGSGMPSGPRPNPAGLTQGVGGGSGEGGRPGVCAAMGSQGSVRATGLGRPYREASGKEAAGAAGRAGSRSARLCVLHASGCFALRGGEEVVGVRGRARGASVGFAELERVALLGQCPRSECMKLCRGASGLLGGEPLWGSKGGGSGTGVSGESFLVKLLLHRGLGPSLGGGGHSCGRIKAPRSDGATPEEFEPRTASWSRGEIRVFPPSLSRRWKQLERKLLPQLGGLVIVYLV